MKKTSIQHKRIFCAIPDIVSLLYHFPIPFLKQNLQSAYNLSRWPDSIQAISNVGFFPCTGPQQLSSSTCLGVASTVQFSDRMLTRWF